jgi:hypothetical protein
MMMDGGFAPGMTMDGGLAPGMMTDGGIAPGTTMEATRPIDPRQRGH